MPPIRLGDGTVVTPKGFAEVRKGDGTVIYSPGNGIPDSGLLHYWPANEGSGTTLTDNNGSIDLTGTFQWGTGAGADNNYASFDGVDDIADSPQDGTAWDDTTLTVRGWFRPQESGNNGVAVAGSDRGNGEYGWRWISGTSDEIKFQANGVEESGGTGGNIDLTVSITEGEWIFLAAVLDAAANEARAYDAVATDGQTTEQTGNYNSPGEIGNQDVFAVGADGRSNGGDLHYQTDASLIDYDPSAISKSAIDDWFNETKGFFT